MIFTGEELHGEISWYKGIVKTYFFVNNPVILVKILFSDPKSDGNLDSCSRKTSSSPRYSLFIIFLVVDFVVWHKNETKIDNICAQMEPFTITFIKKNLSNTKYRSAYFFFIIFQGIRCLPEWTRFSTSSIPEFNISQSAFERDT